MLTGRLKRRLRRHRLSEEANRIEWEDRREVRLLRAKVERLGSELEAKCVEMQSLRDKGDLVNKVRESPGDTITTNITLSAIDQELEQQIMDLKAKLQQREVESEDFEDAEPALVTRDLNLNEDDGRISTSTNFRQSMVNDDLIGTPTGLDISFPSPPPTMPNTPCKYSPSKNARVQDLADEVLDDQLHSELGLRREIGPVDDTLAQPSTIRSRNERRDPVAHVVGGNERRQGTRWMPILVPFFSTNDSGKDK